MSKGQKLLVWGLAVAVVAFVVRAVLDQVIYDSSFPSLLTALLMLALALLVLIGLVVALVGLVLVVRTVRRSSGP